MSSPFTTRDTNTAHTASVFRTAVHKNFAFLKQTTRLDDIYAKSIALPNSQGFLLPVCELHLQDEDIIACFARWREENSFAFPSQFPVTIDGTRNWLRSRVLEIEDRMLFLVVDAFGRQLGHLGFVNELNSTLEIDNVVRGEKRLAPGIMKAAMISLINWGEEVLGAENIFLRVFSDNKHAIDFYRLLGFQDEKLIPLRRLQEDNTISFNTIVEGDISPPDRFFLKMNYVPKQTEIGAELILTAGPSISARETSYCLDAARAGWNTEWNKYIQRFELAFADYLGMKYALSTSSCTGALHLALLALDVGPGDEVIVPDITWVATANTVVYCGATPIFADVEPDSWCMNPKSFEQSITERTKAVIPVHLYGHPARMDKIMEIARKYNLYVVEDAAPAVGAEFMGKKVGTFGEFAAFSFQGAKLMVTGEGGMLVTNSDELYRKVHSIWDQGRTPGTFSINEIGWKYKMSNIQAAFGLGQLERVDEFIEAKRRIFSWYTENLEEVQNIRLNHELPWARSIYWMSSLLLDEKAGLTVDQLRSALKKKNIDTRSVFPAISQYPIWPKPQQSQPVAHRIGNRAINLPSGVCLKRQQVDYICRSIKEVLL